MTPIVPEACARIDRVQLEKRDLKTESVFESPTLVDKRPWLASAFMKLLQVQRQGKFEPGIGDFRVTDETLNMAGRLLGSIKFRCLPAPSLFALPGGGIQINWSNGCDSVEASVFPNSESIAVARLVNDVLMKTLDLESAEYGQMNVFLADFVG